MEAADVATIKRHYMIDMQAGSCAIAIKLPYF